MVNSGVSIVEVLERVERTRRRLNLVEDQQRCCRVSVHTGVDLDVLDLDCGFEALAEELSLANLSSTAEYQSFASRAILPALQLFEEVAIHGLIIGYIPPVASMGMCDAQMLIWQ